MKAVTRTTRNLRTVFSTKLKSCEIRGTRFVLSSVEEQRLKLLVNGSLNPDYSDSSDDDVKESSDSGEEAFRTTRISQPLLELDTADLDIELPDFSYDRASYIVKVAAQHSPSQA